MGGDFSLVSLIHALGVLQGLVMGLALLFLSRKGRNTLFLGLFLIGFSIEFLPLMLHNLEILEHEPELLLIPLNVSWIVFPLFFIYVQKISILPGKKLANWLVVPGIVSIVIQIVIFFLPEELKFKLSGTYIFESFFILGLIYSSLVVNKINQYLNKHQNEVNNQYGSNRGKNLSWIKYFVTFCLAIIAVRTLMLIVEDNEIVHLVLSCINLILVFSIGICGFVQFNVDSVIENSQNTPKEIDTIAPIPDHLLTIIVDEIEKYFELSQEFTKKTITVNDLAMAIERHPKQVSKAINQYHHKNFNRYINELRVKKAQELLLDEAFDNLSIDGLGQEVGFHSKASFYMSFKKITGTTPKLYREKNSSIRQ